MYADSVNFNEYIQKNLKLYELNNDLQLSTDAAANYIRGEVCILLYYTSNFIACNSVA